VCSTEMQWVRIHSPSTAIHVAGSGGAACSSQHTASCRTLHACRRRRRVLIAYSRQLATLLLVLCSTLNVVNEHHAPLVHGSSSCSVHARAGEFLVRYSVSRTGIVMCGIPRTVGDSQGGVMPQFRSKYVSSQSERARPCTHGWSGFWSESDPECGNVGMWDCLRRES
jgi:hypothetical protein